MRPMEANGGRRRTRARVVPKLSDLRRRLQARRREILARVARTEDELRVLGESVEPEREDEAQEENTAGLLIRLDALAHSQLRAIAAALERMANGTYGRCGTCQGAIVAARLDALPETNVCGHCASRREGTATTERA